MPDVAGHWKGMGAFLRSLPGRLPEPPTAILIVSAHWETQGFRITSGSRLPLIYDYYGFPPHTYSLRYDAPGAPAIAHKAAGLLSDCGVPVKLDSERGFDHGVFVPLKVAFPDATVPVVAMSVEEGLDPLQHSAAGRALAPLREEGVVIIGSGISFHNLEAFGDTSCTQPSQAFDVWLSSTLGHPGNIRTELLAGWAQAPGARTAHPSAEHLIPLMVAAGASDSPAEKIYHELVLSAAVSAFSFD